MKTLPKEVPEQDLTITYGGFIQNGPFQVVTGGDQQHYYRERVSIAPLQTEPVSIRLGVQLRPDTYIKYHGKPGGQTMTHWSWLIVQAKGTPSK
jgi:hypothetical protein